MAAPGTTSETPTPSPEEQAVGMEVYATPCAGIGGRIKATPEDFVVKEISRLPTPGQGKHIIARVTARNWETNALLQTLAARLGIPSHTIGFAGMKDKRAVTTQLMSFPAPPAQVAALDVSGVYIQVLYTAPRPIYRGQLEGNRFHVVIRNPDHNGGRAEDIQDCIASTGGVPNFFGIQRFGIIRPVTHLVGKHIVAGDLERAVMTYAAHPLPGESPDDHAARSYLQSTGDFQGALHRYPPHMQFERTLIAHLARHPGDWRGALHRLPENLARMFVHAYQSFLFNRILSRRLQAGIAVNRAVEGDIVIPLEAGGEMQAPEGIPVDGRNIRKINRQISRGNCYPTAPLVGHDTRWAGGRMGDIERQVVAEEGLAEEQFVISALPRLSSAGMRRIVMSPVPRIRLTGHPDGLCLSFSLRKGCYATSVLREFMKTAIRNY
ncbi:MAG: tRNA pseudouridine(13) synthase TruD [Candidatus Thermoplasmatota archaeon]|nr:tRNA pseudouridine(13) synthase TruD [Candidatus Thermoplasmatota archaeon]